MTLLAPVPDLNPAELLTAFTTYERAILGSAAATTRNHGIYLNAFFRWWAGAHGSAPMTTATSGDVATFLVAECDRGLAARTRRAEMSALRGFFTWLVFTGRCPGNPANAVPAPRAVVPEVEIYTEAEAATILAHTVALNDVRGRQRHAIVATLRYTGMRSGELRTLRRDRLDLSAGRASVIGKGARQRTVLLPPVLVSVLGVFLAEVRPSLPTSPLVLANAHPFVTTPLSGFGTDALAREVELAGLGAGVPGRHYPHKWRHTFATELVRSGLDIHVVQRLLGHASISSTVGYTHLVLDDLAALVGDLWATSESFG